MRGLGDDIASAGIPSPIAHTCAIVYCLLCDVAETERGLSISLLLSDADVRQVMDPRELVEGIEAAYRAEAQGNAIVPPRLNLGYFDSWFRVMPAIVPSAGVMGLKAFHSVTGGGVRYLIILYDLLDGSVLAVIDAAYLTAARTAATSAVAAKYLAPSGPIRLGVIGSGLEAQTHCQFLTAAFDISQISIFSPNDGRRNSLARRMRQELEIPAHACDTAQAAIEDASHVVVATNTGSAQTVACRAEWLAPGQHVSAIGSTNPSLRELDTDVFSTADLVVFDARPEQLAQESADVIQYWSEGGSLAPIHTLSALVAGEAPARTGRDQLTLFKSVGTALQDVAAAEVIYRRAKEMGLGAQVPELGHEKLPAPRLEATSP